MTPARGILWDNDGVLVDTEPLYFRAGAGVLAEVGIELTREAFAEISLRRGASVFELARAAGLPEERVEALLVRRDDLYAGLLAEQARPRDGIEPLLRALHGRVAMGIVTSSKGRHFRIIHERTGMLPFFDFALVREEYARSKPHPEPYLAGIARLGLPADEIVAVEDTARGLAAARAAGLRCLVLPTALNEGESFEGALAVLESPESLGEALERILAPR